MTEPTLEEWTSAYNAYADKARRTGAQSIPSMQSMLETSFGRAVLMCRVMEMRTRRARHEIAKQFAQHSPSKTSASKKPARYWWQRDDD